MAEPVRILVIDDEAPIRRLLRSGIDPVDANVSEAATGEEGVRMAAQSNPEVIVLDLGLPDLDGIEVLKRIREWSDVPVIVLSARGREKDKIDALDAGADDYLTKPFSLGELMARVRVALRHAGKHREPEPATFRTGGLQIEFASRRVTVDSREVHLTPIEFTLLRLLARHAGMVITHRQLLREGWGPAYEDATHYLRTFMGTIRQKIEADPSKPRYIRTETGVGYRLTMEDEGV